MKIGVVEDELTVRKGLIAKLQELYHKSHIYDMGYGSQAIDKLLFIRPDVVFLDIFMPELSGLELLRQVRDKLPYTQFVILTGYREFEYAQQAVQLGAKRYLLKPVYFQDLMDVIDQAREELLKRADSELQEDARRLSDSNHSLLIGQVYNPSAWLDSNQGKVIMFSDRCDDLLADRRIADFEMDGFSGFILKSEEHKIGPGIFHQREEWIARLIDQLHVYRTKLFFNEDDSAVLDRIKRNAAGDLAEARAIRSLIMELLQDEQIDSAALQSELVRWLASMANLRLHVLQQEVSSFMFAADRILQRRNIHTAVHADLLFWTDWVHAIPGWEPLRDRVVHLVLKSVSSINKLSESHKPPANIDLAAFIEEMLRQPENYGGMTLELVAEQLDMHPVTVSKLFKKQTGHNFIHYLMNVKLVRAQHLLANTDRGVNEIAMELGYVNYRYFGQVFKKRYGVSPQQYRRNEQQAKRNEHPD